MRHCESASAAAPLFSVALNAASQIGVVYWWSKRIVRAHLKLTLAFANKSPCSVVTSQLKRLTKQAAVSTENDEDRMSTWALLAIDQLILKECKK